MAAPPAALSVGLMVGLAVTTGLAVAAALPPDEVIFGDATALTVGFAVATGLPPVAVPPVAFTVPPMASPPAPPAADPPVALPPRPPAPPWPPAPPRAEVIGLAVAVAAPGAMLPPLVELFVVTFVFVVGGRNSAIPPAKPPACIKPAKPPAMNP